MKKIPDMSAVIIEMNGEETDEDCQAIAWAMFCTAHPIEAYQHDPEAFWKYFHERMPTLSREQMETIMKEIVGNIK